MAFFIPFLVVFVSYICMGVYPFGDEGIIIVDSYHQYVPFFSEFRDKVMNGDSLLYSWHGGLGYNFWALIAYYLVSPLNIFILIFPKTMVLEAFAFIVLLKISFSGLTFAYYIRRHFNDKSAKMVYFAVFYALSGYVLGYNWNIMWFDCIALFPLIILGLERLVETGKGGLYCITLGLAIICNYYIAIMICIFVCLYFLYCIIVMKAPTIKKILLRIGGFGGYSLIAGGLGAIFLLPTFYSLTSNPSTETFPKKVELYHNFADYIGQHFAAVEPTYLEGMPNVYCGVFVLIAVPLFFFCGKLTIRERVAKILLAAFLLVSLNVKVLSFIWHGFHFPNGLPGRFSFLYIFVLLVMCYQVVANIRYFKLWQVIVAFVFGSGLIVAYLLLGEKEQPMYSVVTTVVFVCVYFCVLCMLNQRLFRKSILQYILFIVLVVEAAGNGIYGLAMNGTITRSRYLWDQKDIEVLRNMVDKENEFFRMERNDFEGRDDVVFNNLRGFSLFSSTVNDNLNAVLDKLGFFSSGNKYSYEGATTITDAIFGIRYLVADELLEGVRNFSIIDGSGDIFLYENYKALSLGFMVDENLMNWNYNLESPFLVLNNFAAVTTGVTGFVYSPVEVNDPEATGCTIESVVGNTYSYSKTGDDGKVTFKIDHTADKDLYLYFEARHCTSMKLNVGGETTTYDDQQGHIVQIGKHDSSVDVSVEFILDNEYSTGDIKMYLVEYHSDVFDTFYNELSRNQWEITTFNSTHVAGRITAESNQIMFTSIPYEKGWTVRVDGEKVEPGNLGKAFLTVYLEPGEHYVEMTYVPEGLKSGCIISVISLLALLAITTIGRQIATRRRDVLPEISQQDVKDMSQSS